jgi:hypothetical protein
LLSVIGEQLCVFSQYCSPRPELIIIGPARLAWIRIRLQVMDPAVNVNGS